MYNLFFQNIEDIYVNPWKDMHKVVPKIIDFTADGDLYQQEVPRQRFINFKTLLHKFGNTTDANKHTLHRDYNEYLFQIRNFNITSEVPPKIWKKKLKVFTYCNKTGTKCRFLICPNVRKFCYLCETINNEEKPENTQCDRYSTSFLISP